MMAKDLTAASVRPLLLALLAGGDSYGYAIIQKVKQLSAGELTWKEGMLYPVLHRLEREGLVTSYWQVAENGRKRKYYRLTPAGREALEEEKNRWMRVHETLEKAWGGGHG